MVARFLLADGDFDVGVAALFLGGCFMLPVFFTSTEARHALSIVKLLGEVDFAPLA